MNKLIDKVNHRIIKKFGAWRHRHLDGFVFIHINKTGGSSIERALRLPLEHKTALEKIEELGVQEWERRYTFAVVRNPWDKVVSHYHYRVRTNQTGLGSGSPGFREWVAKTYGSQDPVYFDNPKMFMPQSDWISDSEGNIIVDYVCRFENLKRDFDHVCGQIGKKVSIPHLKASDRGTYRDYYDENTREIVANWFKKDIENFGYHF